jgi:two-component system response regulator LytT
MKIFLIEDEDAALRRLEKMILQLAPDAEIVGAADGVESTVDWFARHAQPDLIFMDIHLSDGSAFDLLERCTIESPVIFCTAYDAYALDAFRYLAIDYLLKPLKQEALASAIAKYRRMAEGHASEAKQLAEWLAPPKQARRFLIRSGQSLKVVDLTEAAYFYSLQKITWLVVKSGKRYAVDYSLDKLEEMLGNQAYFRINRQFIISAGAIREMTACTKSRVKIILEPPCSMEVIASTEKSPMFKRWLTNMDET